MSKCHKQVLNAARAREICAATRGTICCCPDPESAGGAQRRSCWTLRPPGPQPALTIRCTTTATLSQIFQLIKTIKKRLCSRRYRSVTPAYLGKLSAWVLRWWCSKSARYQGNRQVGVAKLNREKVAHIRRPMINCFMMETHAALSVCLLILPTSPPRQIDPHSLTGVQGALVRNVAMCELKTSVK